MRTGEFLEALHGPGLVARIGRPTSNHFHIVMGELSATFTLHWAKRSNQRSPGRYSYWWSVTAPELDRDFIVLLAEEIDGFFLLRGVELKEISTEADGKRHVSLYTDADKLFTFSCRGVKGTSGLDRLFALADFERVISDAISGKTLRSQGQFFSALDPAEEVKRASRQQRTAARRLTSTIGQPPALESALSEVSRVGAIVAKRYAELSVAAESTPPVLSEAPSPHGSRSHRRINEELQEAAPVSPSPDRHVGSKRPNPPPPGFKPAPVDQVPLIDHVQDYMSAMGFHYDRELIMRFHISLKTKPFVIVSGISGSGKSELPELYGEAIGARVESVPVSPAWTSDEDLLGYYSPVHQHYIPTRFLEFIMEASQAPDTLHLCVLDEMNLARVEYYFARFLSVLERAADRRSIHLYSRHADVKNKDQVPAEVPLGHNLFFIGTINADESVQPLSDKVLDRANVINFGFVDITQRPQKRDANPVRVSTSLFNSWTRPSADTDQWLSLLADLNNVLYKAKLHFAYRVAGEVETWIANSDGLLDSKTAADIQICQRILTKIRGDGEELKGLLKELRVFFTQHQLPSCVARVEELEAQVSRGYIQ